MPNRKEITTSDFYCVQCGKKGIPIARRTGSQREAGHLKKLYCPYCKEETNHAEIRPFGAYNYEDFELEFRLGRFVNGLRVPLDECLKHLVNIMLMVSVGTVKKILIVDIEY